MLHNGIEYGLMQAFAEGFHILAAANSKEVPEQYRYDFDLPEIAEVLRRGSVIGSWLLDLIAAAFAEDPTLARYTGFVEDSGEGRWTIQAAIEEAVPAEVLSAALYARFRSRHDHTFGEKVLSAMRENSAGTRRADLLAPRATFGIHLDSSAAPTPARAEAFSALLGRASISWKTADNSMEALLVSALVMAYRARTLAASSRPSSRSLRASGNRPSRTKAIAI